MFSQVNYQVVWGTDLLLNILINNLQRSMFFIHIVMLKTFDVSVHDDDSTVILLVLLDLTPEYLF